MFDNLSDEQIAQIEEMIKSAYMEGWEDNDGVYTNCTLNADWDRSLAKNESCHIVAGKFMKVVE